MTATGHARPVQALEAARALAGTTGQEEQLEALAELLTGRGPDAAHTWSVLVHGGLAPLAARVFEQRGLLPAFDLRWREALGSALEVNAVRNAVLRRTAIEASRALLRQGITPMWAKGLWLAHYVYEQPALRVMADVDLVVPVGQRQAAVETLLAIGFTRDPHQNQTGAAAWTDTLSLPGNLPGADRGPQIDLHDTIRISAERHWPVERLWASATRTRVAGTEIHLPSAEAGLLYLAAHLFKHGFDLRHALVAIQDATVLLSTSGASLDVAWLERQLSDPRDATTLYLLLAQVGVQPTAAAQAVYARTRARVETLGLRAHADALLGSASRVPLSGGADFSLFEVGEQAGAWKGLIGLARGALRWRRRVDEGRAEVIAAKTSVAHLLARANWRYAYTTYQAGRLHARLEAMPPEPPRLEADWLVGR